MDAPVRRNASVKRSLLAAAMIAIGPADAAAPDRNAQVDLELVLAVDISYSMDADEQQVQREGYASAITSKPVMEAIKSGLIGKIAVSYMEWAGAEEQRVVAPWTVIDGPDSAKAFADALMAAPTRRAYRTSISGALSYSAKMLNDNGYSGIRRVVDISGDGSNNQGEAVEAVRDDLVRRGVVINGLPLMMKRQGHSVLDVGELDAYYRDCVVGGPGAFVVPVRGIEQFAEAVRTKLIMEIAGLVPDQPGIPAAASAPAMAASAEIPSAAPDCAGGERIWRERFGG